MTPVTYWLVMALAGGAGAGCRYIVDGIIIQRAGGRFPWGTWAVNVTGALAAGLLTGAATGLAIAPTTVALIGGGFLGAYTTFSTWMLETLRLLEIRRYRAAFLNLAGPALSGVAAVLAGLVLGAWLAG